MTTSHPHPYPAYKLSGVPWLGDLPEHWEVRRLKQVCSRYSLYGANIAASNYKGGGIRFLRTTDITDDGDLLDGGVFLPKDLVEDYLWPTETFCCPAAVLLGEASFIHRP